MIKSDKNLIIRVILVLSIAALFFSSAVSLSSTKNIAFADNGVIDESRLRTIIFDFDHNHFPETNCNYDVFVKDDLGQEIPVKCITNASVKNHKEMLTLGSEKDWIYNLSLQLDHIYDFSVKANSSGPTKQSVQFKENQRDSSFEIKSDGFYYCSPTCSINELNLSLLNDGLADCTVELFTIRYLDEKPNNGAGSIMSTGSIIAISVAGGIAVIFIGVFIALYIRNKKKLNNV